MLPRSLVLVALLVLTLVPWVLLYQQPEPRADNGAETARIAELETESLALAESNQTLVEKVAELEGFLEDADGDLLKISSRNQELQQRIDDLNRDIAAVTGNFEATSKLMQQRIDDLREELAAARTRADAAEAEVVSLLKEAAKATPAPAPEPVAPVPPAPPRRTSPGLFGLDETPLSDDGGVPVPAPTPSPGTIPEVPSGGTGGTGEAGWLFPE